MRFTDLGFIFILLPLAAVCYYCCPKKARPAALFFISALFFLLAEPCYIWLFAALIPDFIFAYLPVNGNINQTVLLFVKGI